jgi:predicted anti-sigma-YlaC factor YlaD
MNKSFFSAGAILLSALFFSSACSIKKLAINQVANALTGGGSGTVFTGDNDPELVGDALPFAIKMYESLLAANPRHQGLRLQTGSLYVMYANAFLQTPASMLPETEYEKQEFTYMRAKNLYLRGRDIILICLEEKYPGLRAGLQKKEYDTALQRTTRKDAPLLYWAGAGWLGGYAIDPFDMDLGITLPAAAALIEKAYKLDPDFAVGALHEFYILYYGSLPEYMGGNLKKARDHFNKAIAISHGKSSTPYLSLATAVTIKEQNIKEFKELLNKALEIDPEATPENRLVNTLNHRKAKWLLEHIDDYFVETEETVVDNEEQLP